MSQATLKNAIPRSAARSSTQKQRPATTARVLLVEDEPVTAEVFARALRRAGHDVRIARDGNQALHALRDQTPDLVVLDLGLPTVSGIEVLRRLRQGEHGDVPVVVVSGSSPGIRPAAAQLVAPGVWLEKPLRPSDLVAAVDALQNG